MKDEDLAELTNIIAERICIIQGTDQCEICTSTDCPYTKNNVGLDEDEIAITEGGKV